jgi:hypothetical protein
MRALVLVTMLSLVACKDTRSPKVRVGFTVKVPVRGQDGPLEDRPLVGADRLVTWVERGMGETVDGSMRTVSLPATSLSLPALPFGDDLVLRVDAYGGDVLLSRGRSFRFGVARTGTSMPPDVFLGSLGRFGRRLALTLPSDVVAILPTSDGALLAFDDGRVARLSPFAEAPLAFTSLAADPSRAFVAVGARYLAAYASSTKTFVFVAPSGEVAHSLTSSALARHGVGAMLAADVAGDTIVIVGGDANAVGEDARAVTRVDVPTDVASAVSVSLTNLPATRWGAAVAWVDGTAEAARMLVLGGQSETSASDAFLIDPRGSGVVTVLPSAGLHHPDATLLALGTGQVLSVGGAAGSDVRLLIVATAPPSLTLASPSPPALAVARARPRLVRFADALALVLGGTAGGGLVRSAELVDMRVFPGSTVQTGSMPTSVVAPNAATLPDGSVWVFDRGGVFGYVPPRGQ